MTAIPAALPCPLAAQSAVLENESTLSLSPGSPQATSPNLRARYHFFDVISGIFRFVHKNANSLLSYLSRRIAAIFSSIHAPAPLAPLATQGTESGAPVTEGPGGPRGENEEAGHVSLAQLPPLPIEYIFRSLTPKDRIAFSTTAWVFRQLFLLSCQQRCQRLLDSDAGAHAFERFGIKCSDGAIAIVAQMKTMVARIRDIIGSVNEVLEKSFPGTPACTQTAEDLVWQLPPARLQGLLETAYQCNLYRIFAPYASPPAASTLEQATASIRAWLAIEEARQLTYLKADNCHLTCLSSEIGSLTTLRILSLRQNQIASLPAEFWRLTGLISLDLGQNRLETIPPAFRQLTELQALFLDENPLETTTPAEVTQLPNLSTLVLYP